MSFATRSFRIAPGPLGSEDVVLDTLITAVDARALSTALAWLRSREYLAPEIDSADTVLALRALVVVVDLLDDVTVDGGQGAPLSLRQDQVLLLAEGANRYVAERDIEGYMDPRERERLERLRILGERLFDSSADFAGAVAEYAARVAAN